MNDNTLEIITTVALRRDPRKSTFDHLAEEVMELHLSMRGKHPDTPAMEWLEIATIAACAFGDFPQPEQRAAFEAWKSRHADGK